MGIRGILHLALAVKDARKAAEPFQRLLGVEAVEFKEHAKARTREAWFTLGGMQFQLCQSTIPDGRFSEFIRDHGDREGLHHICFEVDNIRDSLAEAVRNGATVAPCRACQVVGPHKHRGGWVAFLRDHVAGLEVEFLQPYQAGEGPDSGPQEM
jgi:methylmalonyl-CoA/ethylmalonyl-CoA epimerase